MSETNNKPTKFLDYEGLQIFWEAINTKFNELFATKSELDASKISDLTVEKTVNKDFDPMYNGDLAWNLDIKLKLGTSDNNIFTASIPVVDRLDSTNTPGLITPTMYNNLKNIPEVSNTESGLMTPAMLDKLEKSIQNKLLSDSNVLTEDDGNTYLNLTFEYADGNTGTEKINVSTLVDVYNPGEGIDVSDNNDISIDVDWLNGRVSELTGATSTTTTNIQIAGGPLADNVIDSADDIWPDDWMENGNKIIPSGKTLQEILTTLFLKEIDGTVTWGTPTWNPTISKPTITFNETAPIEVGNTISFPDVTAGAVNAERRTAICKCTQGYFTSEDGVYASGDFTLGTTAFIDGESEFNYSWNYSSCTKDSDLQIIEGNNVFEVTQSGQTATCTALPPVTIYASTNTKKILKDVKATLSDKKPADISLTSNNSRNITGKYKYFLGYSDNTDASQFDSNSIRQLTVKTDWITPNDTTTIIDINNPITSNGKSIVIACPAKYELATISNGVGANILPSFTSQGTVQVQTGSILTDYTVYVYPITNGAEVEFKNVTLKKANA